MSHKLAWTVPLHWRARWRSPGTVPPPPGDAATGRSLSWRNAMGLPENADHATLNLASTVHVRGLQARSAKEPP